MLDRPGFSTRLDVFSDKPDGRLHVFHRVGQQYSKLCCPVVVSSTRSAATAEIARVGGLQDALYVYGRPTSSQVTHFCIVIQ